MTLEAVAARSGVSKGGLIYNFPTKEALMQAMIARMIEDYETQREVVRQELAERNPSELMIEIKMNAHLIQTRSRRSAAILAVVANQPELMDPFRDLLCERFKKRIASAAEEPTNRAVILFFAAFGMHFAQLLHFPFLDGEQQNKLYEDLLKLAGEPAGFDPARPTQPSI